MNEYEAIAVYAGYALIVFAIALIWQHFRDALKKRFHLVNYRSDHDDPKIHRTV